MMIANIISIGAVVAFLNIFYVLYVFVMGVYRAHLAGKLRWYHWVLLWWVVLIGLVMDFIVNCTIAWVAFLEPPREWTVTTRMTRYRAPKTLGTPWQQALSAFICDNLLDPFDPNGEHC